MIQSFALAVLSLRGWWKCGMCWFWRRFKVLSTRWTFLRGKRF